MVDDPEALAQRRRERTLTRRCANQRETFERKPQRFRVRTAIDDEVDLKLLHRRIEKFFDDRSKPMNLVDEQHVAFLERRQDADEVLGFFERRPDVGRNERCKSCAINAASVVLPRPGGP